MARYRATITVPASPAEAFAFVSDFRNAYLWDPRVSGAEKETEGPVRVGTRFRLWSPLPVPFASKEIELPYEVTELAEGERLVLDGRTKLLRYRDVITFEPAPSAVPGHGCRITYDARLRLSGPLAVGDPLLRPVFRKAGDDAVAGIERALRAEASRRRESAAAGGAPGPRVPDLSGEITPETVAAVVAMDDRPVLRNLLITECYHRIALRLDRMLGGADANWCAYATWASKTAGAFIREEELHEGLRRTLLAKAPLRRRLRRLHEALGHDRHDGGSAFYTDDLGPILGLTGEIARYIRAGNREVFAELGGAFAAFAEELEGAREPDPAKLDAFLDRFRPGDTVPDEVEERDGEIVLVRAGGQEMLRQALRAYHDALFESDPKRRAELVLLGSALGGMHEQTRLDPYIRGALGAPVGELVHNPQNDALAQRLKRKTLGEEIEETLREALDRPARRLAEELAEAVREISTFHLMTLRGPDGVLALGDDLPAPASRRLYPETLDPLEHPELVATLARYGAYPVRASARRKGATDWKLRLRRGLARLRVALRLAPPLAFGSAARDWGDLGERMRYIFVYFRSRQGERSLLQAPFDPRQTAAIAEGHVPRGRL